MRLLILLSVFLGTLCGDLLALAEKPKIIFDTDITGDVDDVLALAMCHALADRGACDFLGVTISKHNPLSVSFVDAQNTFYNRPNLPIGVTRDPNAQTRESKFLPLANSPHYPHDLTSNAAAPDAVDLLHTLLSAQPDHSVTLISVGIASNLANLLKSPKGLQIIKQKIASLSLMAGAFTFCNQTNYHLEANIVNGIGYMQTVAKDWPQEVPIIWSGFEIGESLPFPRIAIQKDLNYLPHHIVKEAYLLFCGPQHDRPCWDESSVLQAVIPERDYFGLSKPGHVQVLDDGFTRFHPHSKTQPIRRDRFLTLSPTQQSRALEAIVQFTVQPPKP
jgi:hypothetical protein